MEKLNEYVEDLDLFKTSYDLAEQIAQDWVVLEVHGAYQGLITLARYLAATLDDYTQDNQMNGILTNVGSDVYSELRKDLIAKGFENVFFEEIEIAYINGVTNCDKQQYDDKEKLLKRISIYIDYKKIF